MRILFVSDEDRCRGPMARAIAERLARKADLEGVVFDSCGVGTKGNEGPTLESATFMRHEKYNILNHRSKALGEAIADGADVILCMTSAQVAASRKLLGDYYAPKVVLLTEAIDLATKKPDVDPPDDGGAASLRRLYAALSAAMGRLVRTLEDSGVTPEMLGAKSMARKHKPGTAGAGPRATASTLDPEKRRFLASIIFDVLERSFEPHTTSLLLDDLRGMGQELSQLELEEILRQDLHDYVKQDKDGVWNVSTGAREKRREQAKAHARARADQHTHSHSHKPHGRASGEHKKPAPVSKRMTEQEAFEVLGITAASAADDARTKYRALIKRYHPDKFHDDDEFRTLAEEKAKKINEAWSMLKSRFEVESTVEEQA